MKGSKSRAGDGDGVQPAREPGDIHRTAATGDLFAAAKYDHRRNASDVESRGKCRLVFRIQFCEPHVGFELPCGRFEERPHGNARAAPGSPKIHD